MIVYDPNPACQSWIPDVQFDGAWCLRCGRNLAAHEKKVLQ